MPPGKIYRIAICGPWDSAMIYLPPDYEPVVANEPAEFFLSTTRWMCQNMRPGTRNHPRRTHGRAAQRCERSKEINSRGEKADCR